MVVDYVVVYLDFIDLMILFVFLGFFEVGGGVFVLFVFIIGDWVMCVVGFFLFRSYLEDGFEDVLNLDVFCVKFRV